MPAAAPRFDCYVRDLNAFFFIIDRDRQQ